jgi:tropomyosin
MAALRVECDDANSQVEEMKARIKVLEQENLAKEQEITSLTHKNTMLENEVEKLESGIKDAKRLAEEGSHAGSQNESLARRLQLLEEEAEQADRNLRETNEKYDHYPLLCDEGAYLDNQ